jgi:ferric enterobactin receptor
MPGVNLTGNSTSGQRGNNRQIDIRGMGPENTLILIDGKPVTSRNSVRLAGAASATPAAIPAGCRRR